MGDRLGTPGAVGYQFFYILVKNFNLAEILQNDKKKLVKLLLYKRSQNLCLVFIYQTGHLGIRTVHGFWALLG